MTNFLKTKTYLLYYIIYIIITSKSKVLSILHFNNLIYHNISTNFFTKTIIHYSIITSKFLVPFTYRKYRLIKQIHISNVIQFSMMNCKIQLDYQITQTRTL